MEIYQHDNAKTFRFVLEGELSADAARELGYAWETARSVIGGKQLLVDISGLASASTEGIALLVRLQECGASLMRATPPAPGTGGDGRRSTKADSQPKGFALVCPWPREQADEPA